MSLLLSYQKIKDRIQKACQSAGRSPDEVCLIAVSKKQSPEKILQLAQAGHRDFGENYIQEWQTKVAWLQKQDPKLASQIRWHFIGHLQSNKVKFIAGQMACIHTVDRLKLAEKLFNNLKDKNLSQTILLQVNLGGESTKTGLRAEEVLPLAEKVQTYTNLKLGGLMTIPKPGSTQQTRGYFKELKSLLDEIRPKLPEPKDFYELSMGMSADFELAISEGSTLIRIGTALFGSRD